MIGMQAVFVRELLDSPAGGRPCGLASMAFPPVSILIPAYNYAAFLGATLESALAQDFDGEMEVLVVDDGSEDDTSGVVASFGSRVRYHWKKNAGLSAARNSAM